MWVDVGFECVLGSKWPLKLEIFFFLPSGIPFCSSLANEEQTEVQMVAFLNVGVVK